MAQDTLVKEVLTEGIIKAGADLTKSLDELGWPVNASLWFYFSDENQWRLIVASPAVEAEGPKKAYGHVLAALKKVPEGPSKLNLQDISVLELNHPLISLLRISINTGPGISGIRFSKNVINGQMIDDAYIYRLQ